MSARIDRVQTNGIFSLDGGTWDVENNVWIIGDVRVNAPRSPDCAQ
ncbi:MAG: MBL fold metallo-hydrolase, partial [Acidobacteria bacterium]|nr:MBL fold metallo-hydrolase [Acidobacteriota bacterium]